MIIYEWDVTKFNHVPSGYWKELEHQRSFVQSLAKQLHISTKEEWKIITIDIVKKHGGEGLLRSKYGGSIAKLLAAVYPEYP